MNELRVYSRDITEMNEYLKREGLPLVDGLLGADILERGRAVIDYRDYRLYLKSED